MSRLADRTFDMVLRNRVTFGAGAIATLPAAVAAAGGSRVFLVTDPGVMGTDAFQRVRAALATAAIEPGVFGEVEPNPGSVTVERGAAALRAFGLDGCVVVPVGGGSSMDTAKALNLRAANDVPVLALEYDGPTLAPGRPVVAVPTTAGTGAETNSFGVITDERAGRKVYVGHPSLLPVATILDPVLTVGLPPATTAATGIDALTHSLESLLSANPNPFAEAMALGVIRTVAEWLPRAVVDGSDLEARSQMLVASHLAGVGQASGTGVGLIHALGHALGTRGRLPHGTALASVMPAVLRFYIGTRDRELALVAWAMGVGDPREPPDDAAAAAVDAIAGLIDSVGQRRTLTELGIGRDAIALLVEDALDDPAILNSPRLPTTAQATTILEAAYG